MGPSDLLERQPHGEHVLLADDPVVLMDETALVTAVRPLGIHGPRDLDGIHEGAVAEQTAHEPLRSLLIGEAVDSL